MIRVTILSLEAQVAAMRLFSGQYAAGYALQSGFTQLGRLQ